ncbi:MAG: class I SAM-dependent methyltransferase [Candidatus Hodarchaeota archaeon]
MEDTFPEIDKDSFRKNLTKYTRKAFHMLPELVKPRILDIGCGSGVPTIELAKLCNGEVIGIDIDQSCLDKLNNKIKAEGLTNRVKAINCSLFEIKFPNESFDILWTEGAITNIGFENGLKDWRRLLKSNGFLVVHDDTKDMEKKISLIPSCGYKLLSHFTLPEEAWWKDYYKLLENRLNELRLKKKTNPAALKMLQEYQNELERVKSMNVNSVFFILQKD